MVSTYRSGDVLEGTVTKVVSFGAFVEILDGVEGLVHISELADHHVENPGEVVELGAKLNVKILEIDEERRRLSLSIKRVEGQNMLLKDLGAALAAATGTEDAPAEGAEAAADTPELGLSEDVFTENAPEAEATEDEANPAAEVIEGTEELAAEAEVEAEVEEVIEEAVAEAVAEEVIEEAVAEEVAEEIAEEIVAEEVVEEAEAEALAEAVIEDAEADVVAEAEEIEAEAAEEPAEGESQS